jgi:hypothetical protein
LRALSQSALSSSLGRAPAAWSASRQRSKVGHFQTLRGDFAAAAQAFERSIALGSLEHETAVSIELWTDAVAGLIAARTELGATAEAIELGERALAICE